MLKKLKHTIKNRKLIKVVGKIKNLTFVYSFGNSIMGIIDFAKDFI